MRAKLALAVVLAAFGASSATAQGAAGVPRDFYGVTPQTDLYPEDFVDMGKGKVGTLRVEMSWSAIEPPPFSIEEIFRPRPYRWNQFDPQMNQAARRGIEILPTVYGTPYWIAQLQGCQAECHKLGPNTTAGYVAFSLFLTAAVKRYGPHGDYWRAHPNLPYHPIRAWQIWNEQNSSDYWKPEPNVADYSNLLSAAGEAIHKADPGATVIPGGMIGEPAAEGKKTVSGWDFLKSMLANPRARAAFDAIAVHPYGGSMYSVKRVLWRWRQELQADHAPESADLGDRDRLGVGRRRPSAQQGAAGPGAADRRRARVLHREARLAQHRQRRHLRLARRRAGRPEPVRLVRPLRPAQVPRPRPEAGLGRLHLLHRRAARTTPATSSASPPGVRGEDQSTTAVW